MSGQRVLDLPEARVGQLDAERRQRAVAPETPEPCSRRRAGLAGSGEGRPRDLLVERMPVVRAREHDEPRGELGENGYRVDRVESRLEACATAGFEQLGSPLLALAGPAERARDVDDSPAGVAEREQRTGGAEDLVVGMR